MPSVGVQINETVFTLKDADFLSKDYFDSCECLLASPWDFTSRLSLGELITDTTCLEDRNATKGKDYCPLGVQDAGDSLSLLGFPFENNVVAACDREEGISFRALYYSSLKFGRKTLDALRGSTHAEGRRSCIPLA